MAIVGFTFTNIQVSKTKEPKGKTTVSHEIKLRDMEKVPLALGPSGTDGLKFGFRFAVEYEPSLGKIALEGHVLYLPKDVAQLNKLLDQWKKDKKVDKELEQLLLRNALSKCLMESVIMAREINLPAPIPFPQIVPGKRHR